MTEGVPREFNGPVERDPRGYVIEIFPKKDPQGSSTSVPRHEDLSSQRPVDPLIERQAIMETWRAGLDRQDDAACVEAEQQLERLLELHPELRPES